MSKNTLRLTWVWVLMESLFIVPPNHGVCLLLAPNLCQGSHKFWGVHDKSLFTFTVHNWERKVRCRKAYWRISGQLILQLLINHYAHSRSPEGRKEGITVPLAAMSFCPNSWRCKIKSIWGIKSYHVTQRAASRRGRADGKSKPCTTEDHWGVV